MTIIAADTFQRLPEAEQPTEHDLWESGTVEVTLRKETKRVKAIRWHRDGAITAYGMTGRYLTGAKAWPASVTQRTAPDGRLWDSIQFGRDDRSGKFRKATALSFA